MRTRFPPKITGEPSGKSDESGSALPPSQLGQRISVHLKAMERPETVHQKVKSLERKVEDMLQDQSLNLDSGCPQLMRDLQMVGYMHLSLNCQMRIRRLNEEMIILEEKLERLKREASDSSETPESDYQETERCAELECRHLDLSNHLLELVIRREKEHNVRRNLQRVRAQLEMSDLGEQTSENGKHMSGTSGSKCKSGEPTPEPEEPMPAMEKLNE